MKRTIALPLYYTGLRETAMVRTGGGAARRYRLDTGRKIQVEVAIPALGWSWLTIE